MATYQKRGGRPKTKVEKESQIEKDSTTAGVFKSLDEGASRTEAWIEKNKKAVLGTIGGLAVIVLGSFLFYEYVQKPKGAEAVNEMFQAQYYWEQAQTQPAKDSLYNLALQGGEGKYGLLDIIDNYKGTDAANLAHYYAGMAYLDLKQYKEAVEHLDKYSSKDEMLAPLAKGAIGDAFIQLNQKEDALKYYEEASRIRLNDFTTPRFLFKAGMTAMALNKNDVALKHFKEIEKNYGQSQEAEKAKVYAGRVEAMK